MSDDIWIHFDKLPELKINEILLAQVDMEKFTRDEARSIF